MFGLEEQIFFRCLHGLPKALDINKTNSLTSLNAKSFAASEKQLG